MRLVRFNMPEGYTYSKRSMDLLNPNPKRSFPFRDGEVLLFLGVIEKMEGCVAVVSKTGEIFWGFHQDHFTEVEEIEI